MKNYWELSKAVKIQTSQQIVGGFSVGFDREIPEDTRNQLIDFVYWVENNYEVPVTVWVDFLYRHYLIDKNGQRVGYRFYCADFENYPVFEREEDIPVIDLPVRTERWTMEEILTSFIGGLTHYFAWLCNEHPGAFTPDPDDVEEVLRKYLSEIHKNA